MPDNDLHELELEEWRSARDHPDAVRHVSEEELMRPTKEELEAERSRRD